MHMIVRNSARTRRRHLHTDCEEGVPAPHCCRYPLIVDFDKFGWDFIIQPRQYPAYYCAGECHLSNYFYKPHPFLVSLQRDSGQAGGPCCTPVSMSAISMIYVTPDGNINAKELDEMVVDSCGCN